MKLQSAITMFLIIFFMMMPVVSYARHHHVSHARPEPLPEWCQEQGYSCLRVKSGQSWKSLFPDQVERDIVMRINRTNRAIYGGIVIEVPDHLAMSNELDFSPLPRNIDAQSEKVIIVDLTVHAWGAYGADGSLVRWGPATGGSDWCRDIHRACRTKPGTFRVYSLGSSSCVSRKFPVPRGGAPMPYCMFFDGGQALHGSPGEVVRGNISHGCVRIYVNDAEWLRYDFVEGPNSSNNYHGTKVVVKPYGDSDSR